jgi:hypothetical protein
VSPYWSVVRSNGGYGVDTSTKVVVESSRAAAGDDDHRSRSRGQRPRKMHSIRGGVHAVDMIDATSRKPPPITAVQSDRAADLCRQHGVAVVNDAAGGQLFCEARANRSHLARLQFLHAGPGLEISEQCRGLAQTGTIRSPSA